MRSRLLWVGVCSCSRTEHGQSPADVPFASGTQDGAPLGNKIVVDAIEKSSCRRPEATDVAAVVVR